MLTEICAELNNYFVRPTDIHDGSFSVVDGSIEPLEFLSYGQFFRIVGSTFNDGVWQYGVDADLEDETFEGQIWAMKVPKAVVDLDGEIAEWVQKNATALDSPYQSESFGGYSYSKGGDGSVGGWQGHFSTKLRPYKKVRVL